MATPASAPGTPSRLEAQLTGKAKQLEEEHAKGQSEAERLREEVNRTRAMRANRAANRSNQRSISSMSGVQGAPSSSNLNSNSPAGSPALGTVTASGANDDTSNASTAATAATTSNEGRFKSSETIKHHASSFPVYAGRPSSSSSSTTRGTSLANFIGGDMRIKGPILNKVRPAIEESQLSHEERTSPQATFLSRNPGLLPNRGGAKDPGVALPGMVKPGVGGASAGSRYGSSSGSAAGMGSGSGSGFGAGSGSSSAKEQQDDKTQEVQEDVLASTPLGPSGSATVSSTAVYDRNLSKSPLQMGMSNLSLQDKDDTEESTLASPAAGGASTAQAATRTYGSSPSISEKKDSAGAGAGAGYFNADRDSKTASANASTPSLGRLAGSSIVKQRLQWGEAQNAGSASNASGSTRSSPANSPRPGGSYSSSFGAAASGAKEETTVSASTVAAPASTTTSTSATSKRSSVLDRWNNRDAPDQSSPSSSPRLASSGGFSISQQTYSSPRPATAATTSNTDQAQSQTQTQTKWPKPSYGKPGTPSSASKPTFSQSPVSSPAFEKPKIEIPDSSAASASGSAGPSSALGGNSPASATSVASGKTEPPAVSPKPTASPSGATSATFQRPSTKPPWLVNKDSKPASPSTTSSFTAPTTSSAMSQDTIHGASMPKLDISAASPSSVTASARSPLASPKPSRSLPTPGGSAGLPISVSPTPYARSSQPSPASPRSGTFQHSASSFPVSLGMAPTHSRPLSLAHFMGGDKKIAGPVLNKVRPEESESYGLETDASSSSGKVGSFLTRNPGVMDEMMRKQRVAMPGMVKSPMSPPSAQPQSQSPSVVASPIATAVTAADPASKLEEPHSQSMERKVSSNTLPLPGHSSPKLPLPGELPVVSPEHGIAALPNTDDHAQSSEFTSPSSFVQATSASAQSISHALHASEKRNDADNTDNETLDSQASPASAREEEEAPTLPPVSLGERQDSWSAIAAAMMNEEDDQATIKPPPPRGKSHRPIPSWEGTLRSIGKGPARHAPRPPSVAGDMQAQRSETVAYRQKPLRRQDLPGIDTSALFAPSKQAEHKQYISIDILSLSDAEKTHALPPSEQSIFYSTELLAIVLRSKQGGLVSTEIIVWKGRHCAEDGRVKVQELEGRYRTSATVLEQGRESLALLRALGGRLVTRSGFRATFDVLNTTLYRVQMPCKGIALIDEVELQANSLCSAYSYIASVFQDLFVWYGRGSSDAECGYAVRYAEELARAGPGQKRKVAHMLEGAETEIWQDIMGGEETYASANHWRFRADLPLSTERTVQIFKVLESTKSAKLQALGHESIAQLQEGGVYLIRTAFEHFVLVTPGARAERQRIALALQAGQRLVDASRSGAHRNVPFKTPLHALLLPSRIPRDLAACLRTSILDDLNALHQPTTMNVIEADLAWEHLGRESFASEDVDEIALLPVGLSPEMLA